MAQLARNTSAEKKSRSFKPCSQVVSLRFAQFTHAVSLNDVCDSLRLHSDPLSAIQGATTPSRNNLSHANKVHPAALAEQLFWKTLEHLQNVSPAFGTASPPQGRRQVSSAPGFAQLPVALRPH